MAQTYASALAGALVLALMLSPVLCLLLFKNLKPAADNFFVRFIKHTYLIPLMLLSEASLAHRAVLRVGVRGHAVPAAARWDRSSCRSWRRATSGSATPVR